MYNEERMFVDLRAYGRLLEDLITTYRILTGLNKNEFRERFWNSKVKQSYGVFNGCSGIDAKLLRIWEMEDLSEENKAIQMMAVTLGWKCTETCEYFQHEIYEISQSRIGSIEKTNKGGYWHNNASPYMFVHPMYHRAKRRPVEKEVVNEI